MKKIGVFTISSNNYLHYSRTLMSSIKDTNPEYRRMLCLADTISESKTFEQEPFEVVEARAIGIPTFDDMAVRYNIMEFNTAIKPSMFLWILENTDLDAVIYLDPDIMAYGRFEELEKILEDGASLVLTPHILKPAEDGKVPEDYNMLQAGTFNLGFAAANRCAESIAYLRWWQRRLANQCYADVPRNLFTDQRWCDLAPSFLPNLAVLRHPGYNVAYWNLFQRELTWGDDRQPLIDGEPLAFFHFSGLAANDRTIVSKHQTRLNWRDLGAYRGIFEEYWAHLDRNGMAQQSGSSYAYNSLEGTILSDPVRALYRERFPAPPLDETVSGALVLAACNTVEIMDGTAPDQVIVTSLLRKIYDLRPDLQQAFDIKTPIGRAALAAWFETAGPREYGLPHEMTDRATLSNNSKHVVLPKGRAKPLRSITKSLRKALRKIAS